MIWTIYAVLVRCQAIIKKLGQANVVITFDDALYCRAKELVWHKPNLFANVIVRLGGFHIAQNYLLGSIVQIVAFQMHGLNQVFLVSVQQIASWKANVGTGLFVLIN